MKDKGLIIIVVLLVVGIVAVLWMQSNAKQKALAAKQKAAQDEMALALQYIQYKQNSENIDAEESAGVADWLNTISSLGESAASIFGGINLGGGDEAA